MIVDAELDLSEGGRVKGRPETAVSVLIYASDDYTCLGSAIDQATAAIARCRLIREGHAFRTTIQHSVSASIVRPLYAYRLGEDGEIWTELP